MFSSSDYLWFYFWPSYEYLFPYSNICDGVDHWDKPFVGRLVSRLAYPSWVVRLKKNWPAGTVCATSVTWWGEPPCLFLTPTSWRDNHQELIECFVQLFLTDNKNMLTSLLSLFDVLEETRRERVCPRNFLAKADPRFLVSSPVFLCLKEVSVRRVRGSNFNYLRCKRGKLNLECDDSGVRHYMAYACLMIRSIMDTLLTEATLK